MNQCDSECGCGCDKRHYMLSERDLKELANTHPSELQGAGFFSWLKKKAMPITNTFSRISNRIKSIPARISQQVTHIKSAPLPSAQSIGSARYNKGAYPSKTRYDPVFEWYETQEGYMPNLNTRQDYIDLISYLWRNAPSEYYDEFINDVKRNYEQTYSGPDGTGIFSQDIGDY